MNRIFALIGVASVRFRYLIVVAWILITIVVVRSLPSLGSVARNTTSGYGIAAGVLMDTFFVRSLLVPSVVVLLGRWNWWPTKLGVDEPVALGRVEAAGPEPSEG
jgi:uncharacterized membrane protein YdfJ with MMPL/SSD domain